MRTLLTLRNCRILTTPWFEPSASFNPAIHNLRNAIVYKIVHPDANLKDGLPEVHPDIARFLYPPEETMDASASAATVLAKAADLSLGKSPRHEYAIGRRLTCLYTHSTAKAQDDTR